MIESTFHSYRGQYAVYFTAAIFMFFCLFLISVKLILNNCNAFDAHRDSHTHA